MCKFAYNKVTKLNKERVKVDRILANPSKTLPKTNEDKFETRTIQINAEIQTVYDKENEQWENKAIEKIDRYKAFYQYANSFRRSKAHIGSLKSSNLYQSGEKEMADIRQYQLVITTPKKEP